MLYAIVVILVLIADQWLKYWVTANVVLNTGSKELIPGFIKLVNTHNEGATLSILQGARWFFVVLAVVFTVAVVVALAKRIIRGPFGRWTAVMVLAGAVGNGIDRVIHGYVVDMFQLEPKFLSWFGIFNIADIFITIGGILFCFYLIFGGRKEESAHVKKSGRHSGRPTPETEPKASVPTKPQPRPAAEKMPAPAPERHSAPKHAAATAPKHEARQGSRPAKPAPSKPSGDDMDFSLEDIMDEFK